jgi:decaprenylphospho-beta-D-erythro-pentofuranosid-2-ulose 2-reductase
MTTKTVLILGAKSDIGIAIARKFALEGYDIQLAGRNLEEVESIKKDLQTRFDVNIKAYDFDTINYSGYLDFINKLSVIANLFEKRSYGTIVGISSVAGERGRASNYIYGSAKAGFTAFLSGLRNRLYKSNVNVITVLPGPVFTKMTKGLPLPKLLTNTKENVADDIFKAVINKKDIVYTSKIWKLLIFIIKSIPEGIFKTKKI